MASKAKPGRTVGVYDRPAPPKWPKYVAIAVAILLAIISIVVFMGAAEAQPLPAHSNGDNSVDIKMMLSARLHAPRGLRAEFPSSPR